MAAFIVNFIAGFGSAFDMSPSVYERPMFLFHRTDGDALNADWEAICDDGQKALSAFLVTIENHAEGSCHV